VAHYRRRYDEELNAIDTLPPVDRAHLREEALRRYF
jgi:hypothetical protein